MRYITNENGYIQAVSFNNILECQNKSCTEYTGTVPTGYESLSEWNENANINAYKIVNGNLVFDSEEDARLQSLWASQQANSGTGVGVTGDTLPIGSMIPYGKATPPENWLVCDGSAVSRTTYAELFAVIGTSYGSGDGSTTFNLPNKKGKVSVGIDSSDTDFNAIGKTGGEKTHKLTVDEMPRHSHKQQGSTTEAGASTIKVKMVYANSINTNDTGTTVGADYGVSNTGGNGTHNNLQPYQVDNWIIKAFQSSGVVAEVSNTKSDSTTDTYSCDYINKMQKNAITVYRTDEQLVETTYEDVYFQSIGSQIGSKFTLENGQIRIGSGVTQVKVSGAVWVEVEDGYTWGHILKNGNSMSGIMFPSRMANQDVWRSLAFPPVIIDVQEGDIIKMGVTFSVANPNNRYAGFYAGSCYMTVEEL